MPNVIRPHLQIYGDVGSAGVWLSYAQAKLRELVAELTRLSRSTGSRQFRVAAGTNGKDMVEIEVRVVGAQQFIRLSATSCKDYRGFVLHKRGNDYFAVYNDAYAEQISPILGTPRPNPDNAKRTIGYPIPAQLRATAPTRTTAALFTGLMRSVVGCYHARGVDAPFASTAAKTHGAFKNIVQTDTGKVTAYWIVEISPAGIYAAPVHNYARCCDNWDVTAYMPSTAELQADPTLQQYKDTLDLHWAWTFGKTGITQVVASLADIYDHNQVRESWAFSASGAEAQCVAWSTKDLIDPSTHLPVTFAATGRWQLKLSADNQGNVNGTIKQIEEPQAAPFAWSSFWRGSTPAVAGQTPVDGTWNIDSTVTSLDDTFHNVLAAKIFDAPVYLWYIDETPIIMRMLNDMTSYGIDSNILIGFYSTSGPAFTINPNDEPDGYDGWSYHPILVTLFEEREAAVLGERKVSNSTGDTSSSATLFLGRSAIPLSIGATRNVLAEYAVSIAGYTGAPSDVPLYIYYPAADNPFFKQFFYGYTITSPTHVTYITSTAASKFTAKHGNLVQLYPKLVPPDQRTNAVYNVDATGEKTIGGFTPDTGDPIAFVGGV